VILNKSYLGCGAEASRNCFNKITTKLWFDALDIPNTPYVFLSENNEDAHTKASEAFDKWGKVFVKAASQGSSVGCYSVTDKANLAAAVNDAFGYSDQVLIEKSIKPRELEIAAYQYGDELIITEATNLSEEQVEALRECARKAFVHMKLKDLSRIDFFLSEDNEILLNEINTFPGMTPISMFPK